jgi:hypothetical protein
MLLVYYYRTLNFGMFIIDYLRCRTTEEKPPIIGIDEWGV